MSKVIINNTTGRTSYINHFLGFDVLYTLILSGDGMGKCAIPAAINNSIGTEEHPIDFFGVGSYASTRGTLHLKTIDDVPSNISVSDGAVYLNDQCNNTNKKIDIHIDAAGSFSQQGLFNIGEIKMMQGAILEVDYKNNLSSFTSPKDNLVVNIPQMINDTCNNLRSKILAAKEEVNKEVPSELLKTFKELQNFPFIKELVEGKTTILDEYFFEITEVYNLGQRDTQNLDSDIFLSCIASFLSLNDVKHPLEENEVIEEVFGNTPEYNDMTV